MWHNTSHDPNMPSMNIRQIRDTRKLKAWLQAGRTVDLRERDRVIARIVPAQQPQRATKWPDFSARRNNIFGDRVLPGADVLIGVRGRY
jgi:antitoxin (DNA-binding transcriptional repressor) of toxin-antitoxin stability system